MNINRSQINNILHLVGWVTTLYMIFLWSPIDTSVGLNSFLYEEDNFEAFGYKEDAYYGRVKGVLSHSNTRKDKTDMYPCPRLVEMLKSL